MALNEQDMAALVARIGELEKRQRFFKRALIFVSLWASGAFVFAGLAFLLLLCELALMELGPAACGQAAAGAPGTSRSPCASGKSWPPHYAAVRG